jgi:DHA1 family inner membrane transport protein
MGNEVKPRFSRDELILLAILFSAVVIVGTGIQMGSALFPALSRLMGVPVETVTLLVSVWAFTGILSPLFGLPSDRYGHTVFVLIGLGAFILGNLLSAIAPTFSALLVFQVLVGLGYAVFNFSASAVVGDVFAYKTRARAMGIVRVAVSVAALVGVPAATAIADWATARGSFGTVGGLGLVVLAVALALLPKLSRQEAKTQATEVKADLLQTVMGIARQRSAMVGLLAVLAWAAIPTGLFIYLAAWLEQTFQLTQAQVGLTFSMAGVGALIGNALTAAWADRLGKKRSAVIGLLVLSVTAMALPRSSILAGVLIGLIVFFAALEFSFASFSTLMTELAPTGRGTLMSLVSLANGIGTGAAPLVTRPLWESRGYAVIALVLGVVGLGVTAIVGLFVTERQTSVS